MFQSETPGQREYDRCGIITRYFLSYYQIYHIWINRQNQLSVCLYLLPLISGHVKFIWEETIQSKCMHTKCRERLPCKCVSHDLKWVATSVSKPIADFVHYSDLSRFADIDQTACCFVLTVLIIHSEGGQVRCTWKQTSASYLLKID